MTKQQRIAKDVNRRARKRAQRVKRARMGKPARGATRRNRRADATQKSKQVG